MKKNILGLLVALSVSSVAFAADDTGTVFPSGPVVATAAGCSLLTEDIQINTSAGVFGAYACNTTDNIIAVATCHPNGRKGNVTVNCTVGGTNAPAGCTATADPGDAAEAGTATVQEGLTYTASSAGGTVTGVGAQNCKTGGNTTAEAAAAAEL